MHHSTLRLLFYITSAVHKTVTCIILELHRSLHWVQQVGVRSRLPHNAGHSTSNYTSALSPAQSQKLDVPSDSVDPAVVVPLSPVQSHKLDVSSASVHPVVLLCPVQSQKHDDSADLLVVVPLSPVLRSFHAWLHHSACALFILWSLRFRSPLLGDRAQASFSPLRLGSLWQPVSRSSAFSEERRSLSRYLQWQSVCYYSHTVLIDCSVFADRNGYILVEPGLLGGRPAIPMLRDVTYTYAMSAI